MTKYKAVKTEVDGHQFASKKEAKRFSDLKYRQLAGEISSLQLQPKFPICINGVPCFTYIGDFQYVENSKIVVEDVKSPITRKLPVYRIKKKCVEAYYGFAIREV